MCANKCGIGVGLRFVEADLDGVGVDRLDVLHAFILCRLRAAAVRCDAIFPGEDDVVSGKGRAIRPFDVAFQLPRHAEQILRDAAIVDRRDLAHQHRHQLALFVVAGQRLNHHGRAVDLFGAAGKIRVQCRYSLPEQDFQFTVTAAFGMGGRSCQGHRRHRAGKENAALLHYVFPFFGFYLFECLTLFLSSCARYFIVSI
ncbi:hypothetical protein D3C80_648310 [compost metagenome]